MYMNEILVPEAMDLSRKISQVTRYKMKEEKFASENFQIMNYGIGGKISTHVDSMGNAFVICRSYLLQNSLKNQILAH